MIESIRFRNFKVLRAALLPLSPFTLLLGPNGSGKSTVLQALAILARRQGVNYELHLSAGVAPGEANRIQFTVQWAGAPGSDTVEEINSHGQPRREHLRGSPLRIGNRILYPEQFLSGMLVYSLSPSAIALPVQITQAATLGPDGSQLANVLERLRDQDEERFDALNEELRRWLPEYDRILLETMEPGKKGVFLRTLEGKHRIPAFELSQGTILALALLTLAYVPGGPSLIALEEPDRGIHPRLLRDLRDALYRLSYPESCGETRPPIQVIVTSHSPFFLDLYREHPEEVVLAHKTGLYAGFQRLSDIENFEEILGDATLSEVWYSGILGGVPSAP
jgi:predicted ATPase